MDTGALWVVSVPIGDPDDITLRALKTLSAVDYIVAEHSTFSSKLMRSYEIDKPVISLSPLREADVLRSISEGASVALICDSGTPCISDPGARLVTKAAESGISVKPVPGACAVTAALSISGFNAGNFRFMGKVPRIAEKRSVFFSKLAEVDETVVLFESPRGMHQTLVALTAAVGRRRELMIATNLTKTSEHVWRGLTGSAGEIRKFPGDEYVLVVGN